MLERVLDGENTPLTIAPLPGLIVTPSFLLLVQCDFLVLSTETRKCKVIMKGKYERMKKRKIKKLFGGYL